MGIFENFFMKAKGAVDALGEKAGQFVDVSKLNIRVAELKSDLKIEELKKQIAEMKNKVICKFCSGANENNAIYCGKCGKKLDTTASKAKDEDDFSDFED